MKISKTKYLELLATLLVFTMSISLSSCSLDALKDLLEEEEEEESNNPKDVEYVIGLWEGEFMENNYFFDFKENMTVSVYTDSEGTNWAMGFPHDYQWETENDRIWLSEMYDDDGLRMSGTIERSGNILKINWGSGIITLYKTNN